MAEKKTIELEVKSNLGESISDLKALKRQLKDTAAGSEEFKKIFNQIDDLEDKIKSAKNTSSDWIDSLESAGGPIGALGASLNRAKVATQSFGGALKATGIGLVVALIGGLVAAFQDNENAMKKLQPLLNGIGKLFNGVFRAVEPLFNTLVDLAIGALPTVSKAFGVVYSSVTAVFQSLGMLGSAIKKLVSGDFSGAWKDAKSSVNDFSSNYDKSVKRFNEGTKEMSKTEKEESEKRAENRRKAQEKREADQEKAKQTAIAKAKEEADALKAFQDDVLKNQQQMNVDKVNKDIQDKLDKKTSQEERLQGISDQVDAIDALNQKEIDNAKIKKDKLAQDEIDAQKRKYEALSLVTQGGMNLLATLQDAGIAKGKAGQMAMKALTLVQIGIDTASAFSNAVPMAIKAGAEAAKLAGPGAPIVGPLATAASYLSSATMIASNISKAKKLLSSGGSATPASGGGGGATPTPAAPSFNVVGASPTNQLAQTIGNQQQQPIKAYVVSNDVTTAQGLERNIIQSASIG